MTPTIDQIEAALPHVPAGLHCGDLTEPDERRAFAEVVHGIVVAALETPQMAQGGVLPPGRTYVVGEAPQIVWGVEDAKIATVYASDLRNPKQGDRWETRGDTATLVASNDWPPPKPGTHESDLRFSGVIQLVAGVDDPTAPLIDASLDKYRAARDWSKENAR